MLVENLKYLREKRGLNQSQMIDFVGVSRTKWADYERGKASPSIEAVLKIAEFFHVDVKDLVYSDLSNVHLNKNEGGGKKGQNVHLNVHPNVHLKGNFEENSHADNALHDPGIEYGSGASSAKNLQEKYISLLEKVVADAPTVGALAKKIEALESRLREVEESALKHAVGGHSAAKGALRQGSVPAAIPRKPEQQGSHE